MSLKLNFKYKVPPERVWDAITNKDKLNQWYFDTANFELAVGHIWSYYDQNLIQNKILKVLPMSQFIHTLAIPEQSSGTSVVYWELKSQLRNKASKLTLTHNGIDKLSPSPEIINHYYENWNDLLGTRLKNFLENEYELERMILQLD